VANILIIDDDDTMCQSLSLVAKRWGHEVSSANTLGTGLEKAAAQPCDVVFLDVRMPDGNGLDALGAIKETPSAPEIIIMTGYGNANGAELAIRSGAWDYIEKGSSVKDITLSLIRALEYRKQKKTAAQTGTVVALKREEIIGNSPKLKACLDLVAQAAGSDANVFITGETGSGKELFAQAVHRNSARAGGNFVVVDCAAMPETLIEGLLFGHEKGVFTGADQAREGLVRQAHRGTLFLDEVGELPLSLQKAFLRVLQERRFRPLGSQREVESDFRLVAATNRNLDQMVQNGQFREDLLFRLRSFAIELPPLRERPEDIRELVRYYVDKFCERYGIVHKGCSPEFLRTLGAYAWPGNVRELVNALERAVIEARFEPILFPQHLPVEIRAQVVRAALEKESPAAAATPVNPPTSLPPLHEFRENIYTQAEKQYLHDLMALANDNVAEACRLSGLSQSRLYALLKKQQGDERQQGAPA
jgi:two-component system NtrC family response regulator